MRLHRPFTTVPAALLAALLPFLTAGPVCARDDDHDKRDAVRRAVQSGDVLPLAQILPKVRSKVAGDVTGIDIERERGRWRYEFRIIGRDGRVLEVHVDARSGEVERVEEK
jgi:uncharacterized membrane protein YkoI